MKRIINIDRNGNPIEDLSKVELPRDLEISIFETLNPTTSAERLEEESYDSCTV